MKRPVQSSVMVSSWISFIGAGVLDGDGGVVAEDAQEGDGVLAHQVELAVEQLDDAEGLVAGAHRDAGDGLDVELGMGAGEGGPLGVERDVGHDQRVAGGGDPAGDAFAERDAQALEALGVFADGDGVVELAGAPRRPSAWTSAPARRTGPSCP